MIQTILATALLLAPPTIQEDAPAPIFPQSSGPLTIEISADSPGVTYLELIQQYGALTDQHITFNGETRRFLSDSSIYLDRTVTVPVSEVQTFVEHLLIRGDFAISLLKAEGVRLLEVSALAAHSSRTLRENAFVIQASQIDAARAHPAVMFQAVLPLPNTDTRVLSNCLRTMISDANTGSILPAGNTNAMVLVGFGSQLAAMADILRTIDDAAPPEALLGELVFEVVKLEKADAKTIEEDINALMNGREPVPAAGEEAETAPFRRPGPRVIADARTNSLFVCGTRVQVNDMKDFIARLDV